MAYSDLAAVVLAAGKGKRMKSGTAKVLHPLLGRPMISYVLDQAVAAGASRCAVVLGHGAGDVAPFVPGGMFEIVHQKEQLGTGHAVRQARRVIRGARTVIVLSGDTPLLAKPTLRKLVSAHRRRKPAVTLLTALFDEPRGYGRILRRDDGGVSAIVEEKDATASQREVREINTGVYCFDSSFLLSALGRLRPDNRQGEYYLTDAVSMAVRAGRAVEAVRAGDPDEVLGVNSRVELARAHAILRDRTLRVLMEGGVTIVDPATTWVEPQVKVAPDTVLLPLTFLAGRTRVGRECRLGPMVRISHSTLGRAVTVRDGCVVEESRLADRCQVGPFSHLRPGTRLAAGAKIGNFVEVKASRVGEGTKASHLSYIGDSEVGRGVNIGAGTITCNYDGVRKWKTVIEDGVFVGSNTGLVAPVRLGKGSLVGAGSTITEDVPPGALALSRVPQENRKGLASRYLKKGKK